MSDATPAQLFDEIHALVTAQCEGTLDAAGLARLESLVLDEPAARALYVRYVADTASLRWWAGADADLDADSPVGLDDAMILPGICETPAAAAEEGVGAVAPLAGARQPAHERNTLATHKPGSYRRWKFAAVLALAVGALALVLLRPRPQVAVLTFAADARWAAGESTLAEGATLSPGVRHLERGAIRLRFDGGAQVLVIAPASFDPQARDAMCLLEGKISALANGTASGFTVHTPAADVVDLGTEFGVIVDSSGRTEAHVLAGEVRLFPRDAGAAPARRLVANTAARVEADGRQISAVAARPAEFSSPLTSIDLVDVVAGGDGRSGRRDRGIDPVNGQFVSVTQYGPRRIDYVTGRGFQRVPDSPFIDGVAVLDATDGPAPLDSAGHAFAGFGVKFGQSYGPVWGGGRFTDIGVPKLGTSFDDKIDFAVPPNGWISLIPNKLVTFDLNAMRRAAAPRSLATFRGVVGVTAPTITVSRENRGRADVWVFVDGEICYSRLGIDDNSGPQAIEINLPDQAQFLTLAATDRAGIPHWDCVLFGNPRIELESKNSELSPANK